MSSKFYIPPVFVEAESGFIPPLSTFKKRPAEQFKVNDLIHLCGETWRIKDRRTSKTSLRITFVLWNVRGGRPETESFFPREWVLCFLMPRIQEMKVSYLLSFSGEE
jgi:hypothetical protein